MRQFLVRVCWRRTPPTGAYNIVRDAVNVGDLNATILHLLGIDHQRFTVKHLGLDQRLTGVEPAHVVKPMLAG